jgi:hypothetical protein
MGKAESGAGAAVPAVPLPTPLHPRCALDPLQGVLGYEPVV